MWFTNRAKAAEVVFVLRLPLTLEPARNDLTDENQNLDRRGRPAHFAGSRGGLKSEGYETAACNRGDEAVAAVAKFQPTL